MCTQLYGYPSITTSVVSCKSRSLMCLHVYVCVYVYIYVCAHTYVHVCTYVYVCAHTFIYVCVYVYIYVCVYVCTYVYCNDSLRYIIISMQFPATHIFADLNCFKL